MIFDKDGINLNLIFPLTCFFFFLIIFERITNLHCIKNFYYMVHYFRRCHVISQQEIVVVVETNIFHLIVNKLALHEAHYLFNLLLHLLFIN